MKARITLSLFLFFIPLFMIQAERIPVDKLFRDPEFSAFRISPDGQTLAFLGPWEQRANIFIYEIDTGEIRRITEFSDNQVLDFFWANDERILFYMDDDGFESLGLFGVNKDGTQSRVLVPPMRARPNTAVARQTVVIDRLKDDPEHVLVTNNARRLSYPDVFRLNIYTQPRQTGRGRAEGFAGVEVERNPGDVVGWMTDHDGKIRIALATDREKGTNQIRYRRTEGAEWEMLFEGKQDDRGWSPLGFAYDEPLLYVASNLESDAAEIWIYDLEQRELRERVYGSPSYDVTGMVFSDFRRAPIAIAYETDKPQVRWLDEEKQMVQAALDAQFPDTFNAISSRSEDERAMVITSFSDRQPPFYHLVRLVDGRLTLLALGYSRSWLLAEQMAPMRPFSFKARDGVTLHGYLTMPRSWSDGDAPVPMVVNPHGGPWARDSWGFNPEVQFLANRGYAVLQVNFRGSTGYGHSLLRAGDKAWGSAMQHDVIDAVRWAVAEGFADESRIGIYGASYGGYTTMKQLVLYPEVYRWGINYVGVVDLRELIQHQRQNREIHAFYSRTIGDPDKERDLLAEYSPITHIERLRAPVFIVHGRNDPRVPMRQAETLRRAMRSKNLPFEWMVKNNEGHGFRHEENRIELYTAMERFMERHF